MRPACLFCSGKAPLKVYKKFTHTFSLAAFRLCLVGFSLGLTDHFGQAEVGSICYRTELGFNAFSFAWPFTPAIGWTSASPIARKRCGLHEFMRSVVCGLFCISQAHAVVVNRKTCNRLFDAWKTLLAWYFLSILCIWKRRLLRFFF